MWLISDFLSYVQNIEENLFDTERILEFSSPTC